MNQDPTGTPQSRPRASRVRLDAEVTGDPRAAAASLQRACTRLIENLRDTVGADGCAALLARSIARAEREHPVLSVVYRQDGREFHLDGISAAFEQHGPAAVIAGVDAMMTSLVEVLGRLIGEDMAIRIIDLGARPDERRQGDK